MKWHIDFSGWCEIEAKTKQEAEDKFWETVYISNEQNWCEIENVELLFNTSPS